MDQEGTRVHAPSPCSAATPTAIDTVYWTINFLQWQRLFPEWIPKLGRWSPNNIILCYYKIGSCKKLNDRINYWYDL